MSQVLLGEVVLRAVHLINYILTIITAGISHFEKLCVKPPNYFSLRVFGYICFILLSSVVHTKLSAHSPLWVFLSDGKRQKGYHCYDPIAHKLYVFYHVVFMKHIPFFSIPSCSSFVHKFDLIYIDPFPTDVSLRKT